MAELVDQETGRVVSADDADAAELVASGLYRPASPDDVQAELRRAELSDTGSTIAAGLEGAASGISLGLSDVAIQEGLLGDEFAEESRLRAEYNPTARGLGEAGGVLAGTLLTGGAEGLAAAGARGGAMAARGVGSAALRGAITRGAGAAAVGATEGLVFGVGHELSEAALDRELSDPARLAERLAVAGGIGALLGGGLGFAGAAAGSLAGSGYRAIKGRVSSGLARRADDVVSASPVAQVASATDEDIATIASLTAKAEPRTFAQKATAADRLDDVRQNTVRELSSAQDDIARAADANREAFSVAEKPDTIRRIIAEGGGPSQAVRQPAAAKMADLEDRIQDLVARADDFESGGRSAIRQLGRRMENAGAKFDEALSRVGDDTVEEAVEAFRSLDSLKRDLGKAQVQAARGANGSQSAMLEIQSLREDLRGFLEAGDIWGDGIAGFQRELNAKWAPLIDVDSSFQRQFGTGSRQTLSGMKSEVDKTRFISEADPRKISSMVSGLTRAETEKLEGLYRLKLAREVEYQRTASRLFGGDGGVGANVSKIEQASRKAMKALEEARQTTLDAAEYAASQEAISVVPILGEQIAKGRTMVGRGMSLASPDSPSRSAAQAALEGARAIKSAAGGVIKRIKGGAPKAARAARRAGTYLGVKASGPKDVEAYQSIGERVQQLQDPNSQPRQRGRDRSADVRMDRPDVADAYEAQTQRAADFLAGKYRSAMGAGGGGMFGHTRKPVMDPASVTKFLRYVEAVQDPQSILDRAQGGDIRPEDIEVLKSVYPAVYSDLVADVMHMVNDVRDPPSYQERVRLGLLLGVPTDPSLRPASIQGVMASAQRMAAVSEAQQGKPLGGPTVTPSAANPPEAGDAIYDVRSAAQIRTR